MQSVENEYIVEWEDLDGDGSTTRAGGGAEDAKGPWKGTALQRGMKAVHDRLRELTDSLAATPLDIRVDYEMPQAEPLTALRQCDYKLVDDDPQHRRFWLRFRCAGQQRYNIRENSRPARDMRVRWLTQRGLPFHVEDDYGSQWHFSLLVRPIVPVSIGFEADIAHGMMRITLVNFDTLETIQRGVRADAISPAMLGELERLILRRANRFEEYTGNRVDDDVRARMRAAIDERKRSRAEELGEDEDTEEAAHKGDAHAAASRPVTAPTFVGPRDDDGALEWSADSASKDDVAAPPPSANAPPAYGWLITAGGVEDTAANLGKHGPPGANRHFPLRRLLVEGHQFRLRNREGKIVFTGKIAGSFKGPEPITDFGLDHGCMRIEYFRGEEWVELRVKEPD